MTPEPVVSELDHFGPRAAVFSRLQERQLSAYTVRVQMLWDKRGIGGSEALARLG